MLPELSIDADQVVLHLTAVQAVMGLARQVKVPLRDIARVRVVDDGLGEDLDIGWRVAGTGLPRRLKFGRFKRWGRDNARTFAALYAGQPAVVVETRGGHWDQLAFTSDDPDGDAARIRSAAGLR